MGLTKPKIVPTTERAPRVWAPKSGVSIYQGAVVGRYPYGSDAGYIDNIGAHASLVVVGVARTNCGAVPSGHTLTFAAQTIVDEMILPMSFATNSDATTAKRGDLVYGVDEGEASLLSTNGPPIGTFWEADSATSGRVLIGPSAVAAASGQHGNGLRVGTALGDAASTIARAGRVTWVTLPATTLTTNRSYALPALTGCMPGDEVLVTRLDATANTATFTDSGTGTPTLLVMPVSKVNSARFVVNAAGTHWLLVQCGAQ